MEYSFCVFSEKKQRVDMFLSALFPDISRSYIQKMIDSACVKVNGEVVKKNLKIVPRDEIFIQEIITSSHISPENIPLDIVYEDENMCVINKDAGINVHPTPGVEGKSWTLVNALLFHYQHTLPIISGEERPGIVHRLDKDTSGLIMIAKNDAFMKLLSEKIKNREVKKYYIAIVAWIFWDTNFSIESNIGRHPTDKIKMTTYQPINPKYALTRGEVLWYIDDAYTVLKIDLQTGRTHQIRVHLASIWYPIVGDRVYGKEKINQEAQKKHGISRQMLHAFELEIQIYKKNKIFIAPYKDDMKKLLKRSNISL